MSQLTLFFLLKLDVLIRLLIFGGSITFVISSVAAFISFMEDEHVAFNLSKKVALWSIVAFLTGLFLPSSCFMINSLGGVCK